MCAYWRLIGCRYPSTLTLRSGESMFSSRRSLLGINIITFALVRVTQSVTVVQFYSKDLFSNLSSIGLKAIPGEHIIGNVPSGRLRADRVRFGVTEMMDITGIGMGLMMTGVAVAVGGLMLEGAFLMLGRALRAPPLMVDVLNSTEQASREFRTN